MHKALAIGTVGLFYAQGLADYLAVTWVSGQLWRLDETTGSAQQIGALGSGWRANSMARSSDGRYFVAANQGSGSEWLFEIDPETGSSTQLFSTGLSDIRSMAFGADGTLYAVEAITGFTELWSIDLGTQSASNPVSLFGVDGMTVGRQSLAIDASGAAYMAGPYTPLQSLDLTTGVVSDIGSSTDLFGAQSLTFNGEGELVGGGYFVGVPDVDFLLRTYDTATGATISDVAFDYRDYRGMEWIVPAPGVPCLLAAAALGLGRRRRLKA